MKLYLSICFFLLLQILSAHNCCAQPKPVNNDKSLLWQVNSKDMKKPSYIFGTIHMICPQDYIWTDIMKKSFKSSEEVCFEMDMDDPNLMMEIAVGMMDMSGKTLKDYFSDKDYQKLSRYISDTLNMDISMFAQMKPVALQSLFLGHNNICDSPISYEANLMEDAKKEHKEIIGLETVSEQLDLFENLPADTIVKDILNTINGIDDDNKDFNKLVNAYKKQDLPALYTLIKESSILDKDIDGFLDVRNEKWVPRMIEKMDKHAVFFAVGAGHLYGDNGLITLLRKAGYTVTPLK